MPPHCSLPCPPSFAQQPPPQLNTSVAPRILAFNLGEERAALVKEVMDGFKPNTPRTIQMLPKCGHYERSAMEKLCLGGLARRMQACIEKMNALADEEIRRFDEEILPMWRDDRLSPEEREAMPAWQEAEAYLLSTSIQQEQLFEDQLLMNDVMIHKFGITWDDFRSGGDDAAAVIQGHPVDMFKLKTIHTYHLLPHNKAWADAKVAILNAIKPGIKPISNIVLTKGSHAELAALPFNKLKKRFMENNAYLRSIGTGEINTWPCIMALYTSKSAEKRANMPRWTKLEHYLCSVAQKQQVLGEEQDRIKQIFADKYGIIVSITRKPVKPASAAAAAE